MTEPSTGERKNVQVAPYPDQLQDLVRLCRYRAHEGWSVSLEDVPDRDLDPVTQEPIGHGLTLKILTKGYDTYHPERGGNYRVWHYFIVPAATYGRAAWRRWLFECFASVERHECMENFVIDGERPFAPLHGPGEDPYVVHEYADDVQRRTSFRGVVTPA